MYFSQFGALEAVEVLKDRYTGKSRGFGFISFVEPSAALRALNAEHLIDGRRCEAKVALPKVCGVGRKAGGRCRRCGAGRRSGGAAKGVERGWGTLLCIPLHTILPPTLLPPSPHRRASPPRSAPPASLSRASHPPSRSPSSAPTSRPSGSCRTHTCPRCDPRGWGFHTNVGGAIACVVTHTTSTHNFHTIAHTIAPGRITLSTATEALVLSPSRHRTLWRRSWPPSTGWEAMRLPLTGPRQR